MNFDLTKEQKMIRDEVRNFTKKEITPRAEALEQSGEYPYDIYAKMAELGLMGIPIAEAYGGMGSDWVSLHLAIEEVSRGDLTFGAMLDVTTSVVAQELEVFGTEEQKQKWLVPIAGGERIGAFGLTEPDAGSDAGSLRTTAELQGDEWVLNGTKQFITNIGLDNASLVLIAATVANPEQGDIISTFIVPKDAPGFKLGKRYQKMAWHASATHEVILADCRIPKDYLLGDPDRGFAQHLAVLETGRPHQYCGHGSGRGPGLSGRVAQIRPGTAAVRSADFQFPGRAVQTGRYGVGHRTGAQSISEGRLVKGPGAPACLRGVRRQALCFRDG